MTIIKPNSRHFEPQYYAGWLGEKQAQNLRIEKALAFGETSDYDLGNILSLATATGGNLEHVQAQSWKGIPANFSPAIVLIYGSTSRIGLSRRRR